MKHSIIHTNGKKNKGSKPKSGSADHSIAMLADTLSRAFAPSGSRRAGVVALPALARSQLDAAAAGSVAKAYFSMVIDPLDRAKSSRYPDETIVPTGMVHFARSITYIVENAGTVLTGLQSKILPTNAGAILGPAEAGRGSMVQEDYGLPEGVWRNVTEIDRTLAMGIRVRPVGLPPNTFMPGGTLYFIQAQRDELLAIGYATEEYCVQAVVAGKAFSLTFQEVMDAGEVHIPLLPQGPMSYVFSDSGAVTTQSTGQAVAAGGYVFVLGFGLTNGQAIRFDYAHHVEYIPSVGAAGLVTTSVQPPSVVEREAATIAVQRYATAIQGSSSGNNIRNVQSSTVDRFFDTVQAVAGAANPFISAAAGLVRSAYGTSQNTRQSAARYNTGSSYLGDRRRAPLMLTNW